MDDSELWAFLDDLEAQARALSHRGRMEEVADRSRSAYHEVTLEARLMASCGHDVRLHVVGLGSLTGLLRRVGTGWCRLGDAETSWVVRTAAVTRVSNASSRAVPLVARRAVDRLGHASVLRKLADDQSLVRFHLVDGTSLEGVVLRVGSDFVELRLQSGDSGDVELLASDHLAAHREI